MIQPNARSTLVEAVTPPAGYEFDTGIATTYSLDIATLMVLPAHLAWLAASEDEGVQNDPLRLFEGMRQTTKRLSVFADSGRLHVPRTPRALVGLTEEMIYEVQAPHGGAFHPKVWVLRFLREEQGDDPLIRVLVLSRNLTDDRSWDLNLCLEGQPRGGKHATNKELASFVRRLPDICRHKKPAGERLQQLHTLADDLHRCVWDLPPGFSELVGFHVIGLGAKPQPLRLPESDEVLVVSPFVRDLALRAVAATSKCCVGLVARQEEIALLSDVSRELFPLFVLDDNVDLGAEEETQRESHRGLHAKAIIWQRRAWTHVLVGSANCTTAVLERGSNVEVMAELRGHHSKVGRPRDWLAKEKGMGALLELYQPMDPKPLIEQRQLDDVLEAARRNIVAAGLHLACEKTEGGRYLLALHGTQTLFNVPAEIWAWPLTVSPDGNRRLGDAPLVDLGSFLPHEVTSLTGFRVRMGKQELLFGLELPLVNPPQDRDAAVLAVLLGNRAAFVRYLALLLGVFDGQGREFEGEGDWFGAASSTADSLALFELMLKAFSREPARLDYVASVVEKLDQAQGERAESLIPPDFMTLWQVFEEARRNEAAR
jgi:hypothetical protein